MVNEDLFFYSIWLSFEFHHSALHRKENLIARVVSERSFFFEVPPILPGWVQVKSSETPPLTAMGYNDQSIITFW